MIVNFVYPSSGEHTGGVMVLYELANGLSRLGHDVQFLHGPTWPGRIERLDQLPAMCFDGDTRHLIVDDLADPTVPPGDVVFHHSAPARLGLPALIIQGYRMWSEEVERDTFRALGPKFCVATWLQEVGATYGVDPRQLIHIPNGIDHRVFHPRTDSGDPVAARPIDVSALFHPHHSKGWDVLVAALEELRARRPDHRAVVFSRNPPPSLPTGARHVLSPDHEMLANDIYSRTKVFVQASRFEGFGLTSVEAMACGATLVSTDCGGSRDYAFHDETAVVVAPDDPLALATAIEALLDDQPRRSRLAAAGSALVRETFRWERSAALLADHLSRYLADPEPFLVPPGPADPSPGNLASTPPRAQSH